MMSAVASSRSRKSSSQSATARSQSTLSPTRSTSARSAVDLPCDDRDAGDRHPGQRQHHRRRHAAGPDDQRSAPGQRPQAVGAQAHLEAGGVGVVTDELSVRGDGDGVDGADAAASPSSASQAAASAYLYGVVTLAPFQRPARRSRRTAGSPSAATSTSWYDPSRPVALERSLLHDGARRCRDALADQAEVEPPAHVRGCRAC